MTSNIKLLRIIDKIAATKHDAVNHKVKSSLRVSYENYSFTSNKKIHLVNHKQSDTFNTNEYTDVLRKVLGSHIEFKKLNEYSRSLIQSEIEQLSLEDYTLKIYLHKSINEGNGLYKLFPEVFESFKAAVEGLHKGRNTQRGYAYKPAYKLQKYYNMVLKLLIKDQFQLGFIENMSYEEAETIFTTHLTPEVIFDALCVILLKKARDTMFNQATSIFDEKSMTVVRHKVIYHIYNYFSIIWITHSIHYKIIKSKKAIPLDSLLRSIRTYMLLNKIKLSTFKEYLLFIDGVDALFKAFVESGIFTSVVKENIDTKTITKYAFPPILNNHLGKFTQPPRVFRPDKITEKNLSNQLIRSSDSHMSITPVKSVIDSLNISNGKRFSVNRNFVNILDSIEEIPDLQINRPIPHLSDIAFHETKLKKHTVKLNKFDSLFVDLIQKEISKRNLKLKTPFQYRLMVDITIAEIKSISDKNLQKQFLHELKVMRKGGNTRLTQSKLLEGFPLYFTNKLCKTSRPFAHEYLLSRHIGCLKLLRGEYTETKVRLQSVVHIMKSYYSSDLLIYDKFNSFLNGLTSKLSFKKLQEFYELNRINYAEKDAVTHFMLISVELKQIFKTKKTKLLLQIDQVASGLVFMAILFRNKELAIQTNTHYVKEVESPYTFAMEKFEKFYNKNIECKNEKVLNLTKTSRKLHKYAMMCYSYNQTAYGRTEDLISRWVNEFKDTPTRDEWNSLQEISAKYPKFINELFPGLNTQIKLLNDMITIVVKNSKSLRIRTVDGGIIEWKFYKEKKDSRKSFNTHNLTPESFAFNVLVVDKKGNPVIDLAKFKTKFLSYLVHSFDAGIMRQIICIMFQKYSYRVDQLFDCILLHPNQIDNFYKTLEEIYSQDVLDDYMSTHVFKVWRESISADKFDEFDDKVNEFQKICRKCDVKKFKSNVYKMYTYEV